MLHKEESKLYRAKRNRQKDCGHVPGVHCVSSVVLCDIVLALRPDKECKMIKIIPGHETRCCAGPVKTCNIGTLKLIHIMGLKPGRFYELLSVR